jgi:hypothetical protein
LRRDGAGQQQAAETDKNSGPYSLGEYLHVHLLHPNREL